jgi:putative DNA primase/helicase
MTANGELDKFFKLVKYLWRGGAYGTYWYVSPDGGSKLTQWMETNDIQETHPGMGQWHQYFGVHPAKQSGGLASRTTVATIAAINAIYADFDAKDEVLPDEYAPFLPGDYAEQKAPEQRAAVKAAQVQAMMLAIDQYMSRAKAKVDDCPRLPSVVVSTGGGFQCYWLLRETVAVDDDNRADLETLQAEWVKAIGADPGARDLARVLRVPGSRNMKPHFGPDYPLVKIVEARTSIRYALADFEEFTGTDEAMNAARKAKPPERENDDPVIAKWNSTARVGEILSAYKYVLKREYTGIQRFVRPGGQSDSVVVFTDSNRSFHHSSSDPLHCDEHSRDAFDVFTMLEHDGDASAAYMDVKKQLGEWTETVEVDTEGQAKTASEATDEGSAQDPILLEWPVHDHGNASVVHALYADGFAYCTALGWLANTGTHYDTENAERLVNRAITETLIRRRIAAVAAAREDVVKGTSPSSARKNAVKDMFKDLVIVKVSDLDNDPNVLNCINGVIDLRTGQLVAHDPSNRFTYCVPTAYTPAATSELWRQFLAESVGDYDEIADWLQMAVGYSISGLTQEEILYYIEGPTRSGKGTFEHAKLTMLGAPLARGVDFHTFTSRRDGDSQNFDLAPLRAARLISASESGRYSSLNEAVVKNITGNDPITAAFKYRDQFTYSPQFKIWLSSNYPIRGDVDDDAFWGRVCVIRFPHSHLGNEDKTLKWRMADPENLRGILAWAVEGARRWYAAPQGLTIPKAVRVATQKARDELDHVQQWIEECTNPNIGGGEANAVLYKSYASWCETNGHTPKKANTFGRSLELKGYEGCHVKMAGNSVRGHRSLTVVGSTPKEAHD